MYLGIINTDYSRFYLFGFLGYLVIGLYLFFILISKKKNKL